MKLKKYLKDEFLRRVDPAFWAVPVLGMCRLIFGCVRDVFQAIEWGRAFDLVGARGHQDAVANQLIAELALPGRPAAGRDRPSNELLSLCWPRDCRPRWDCVWSAQPLLLAIEDAPPADAPHAESLAIEDAPESPHPSDHESPEYEPSSGDESNGGARLHLQRSGCD